MLSRLDAVVAEDCRRRFYLFFCAFWETIEAGDLELSWHIEFLCDFLQAVVERWERKEKQDDVLINIVFGLSKSTILQLLEAWITCRTPRVKILGTSYAAKITHKNSGKVLECLTSQKFQRLYPKRVVFKHRRPGVTQFDNTAKGIYYTSSTDGAATGMHADFIFNDDPLNAKQSYSKVKRDTVNQFISTTLSSRKTQGYTVTVTVMQRLHLEDPSGTLLGKKKLQHVCLPAVVTDANRHLVKPQSALVHYDAHGGYLNPKRFGESKIQEYRVELGPYAFAAQVMQDPADDSTGIFKKTNFEIISWEQFHAVTAGAKVTWDFDADTALTDDRANDPTALLASCTVENITYIRDVHAKWLGYEDLLNYIPTFLAKNGVSTSSTLFVEPKASGLPVIDSLSKRGNISVEPAPSPSTDKVQRSHNVLPYVYQNRVKLIDGSWIVPFLNELTAFPNGVHDDQVDVLTQCLARALGIGQKKKRQGRAF